MAIFKIKRMKQITFISLIFKIFILKAGDKREKGKEKDRLTAAVTGRDLA